MKKILLSAAAALLSISSAFAQGSTSVVYAEGAPITSASELTTGKYFIKAHAGANNNDTQMSRGEGFIMDANDNTFLTTKTDYFNLPTRTTDNTALVWEITVTEVTDENKPAGITEGNTKVFTIKSVASGYYFSVRGKDGDNDYPANHNIWKTKGEEGQPAIAMYELEDMPDGYTKANYYGVYKDNTRFFMHLTNAQFHNNKTGTIAYPYVHNNAGYPDPFGLGYWAGASTTGTGTAVQFEFIKAEEISSVNVTVNLPAINGIAIAPKQVDVPIGSTLEEAIQIAVGTLNCGAFTVANATSSAETATTNGQEITATGLWEREMIPGHVYRLRIRPSSDAYGAIRYMISTGDIETKRENVETLTRLVPERLWYFDETVNGDTKTYTLHTLYDLDKSIKFSNKEGNNNLNEATATLEDAGTALDFVARDGDNLGDFCMKVNGTTNAWINDFGGFGKMSIYLHDSGTDIGSFMRVYPITEEDFTILSDFATAEQIAAAKANPTVENIKPLIDAYNAQDIESAIKRVQYIIGNGTFGDNPGQFSDPTNGEFEAAYQHAKEVAANPDATEVEKQEAVAAIDIANMNFTFNDMKPGFYRFRSKLNNKRYLSALYGGKAVNKDAMSMTTDNTRSSTVFYVQAKDVADNANDNTYIVMCYENGTVLPSTTKDSWMPDTLGAERASVNAKFLYQNDGCFIIRVTDGTTNRHLHGGSVNTGVANASSTAGTDDGHRWHIERVTELPLTFYNVMGMDDEYGDDGWSSVCSPVALEIPSHYQHLTAYTGEFDGTDYTDKADINHVLATKIEPNAEGKVIIPAGQPALLFYDGEVTGEENPNVSTGSGDRSHISFINVNIVEDYESPEAIKGNLKGSYLAVTKTEGKEYYTLHASHINNFREYKPFEGWTPSDTFIPGFKAYIENDPDGVDYYPIYTINPNTMVPQYDENGNNTGLSVEKDGDTGNYILTIVTPSADYTVYYKHTPETAPQAIRRQAQDDKLEHEFTDVADQEGKVHTITVETPGTVQYYAYHADSKTKGAVREIPLNDAVATGIKNITVDAADAAVCFDLQGRRIAAPAKGISIVNGHKVLIK